MKPRKQRNEIATRLSRLLRRNQPDAELRLWKHLRNRGLAGYKFRRQHPVGPYVADFVCMENSLVIELDGGQHDERQQYDVRRAAFLGSRGFKVIRFWNNDVLQKTEAVLTAILAVLASPHPNPSPGGRRDITLSLWERAWVRESGERKNDLTKESHND